MALFVTSALHSILNLPLARPLFKRRYKVCKRNMPWCHDRRSFQISSRHRGVLQKEVTFFFSKASFRHTMCRSGFFIGKKTWQMLSCNAQFWDTNLFSWVLGSGVLLVLQNSLRNFFDRHSLFTYSFFWFCASLRFSCQSFRASVFVPRSPASKLQDHCYKQSFFRDCFNAWRGILMARHGLFLPHVLRKQSRV